MKQTFSILLKGIAIALFFTCCNQLAKAQASDNTTLNVVLSEVRSIVVNPAQNAVQLDFVSAADYQNGVINSQVAHLSITSTGGFLVSVKASSDNLVNGANTIPVNTIRLTADLTLGSTMPPGLTLPQNVSLSSVPARLIESNNGTAQANFTVEYKSSGGDPYINKPAGTYVTTITYSIEPN